MGTGWLPILLSFVLPDKKPGKQTSQAKFSKRVLRKEVIQPQVPLRLPCYDLVPIKGLAFGSLR